MAASATPQAAITTSVHVKVIVDPVNTAAFLAALKRAQTVVTALPESVSWELYHKPEAPGEFRYTENWNASLEWIMAAAAENEACQEYFATTEKMLIKPREMEVWTRMDGDGWVVLKE
ncbi:hypothetical protein CC86DRAFT_368857 [Ophiobolus disseminans]|uniref:ABM domain-containing protein n=1 Tax=Ophiobolus disseminans TaxID=1469910 RepID=A0A6A7A5X6_9PLEO|nr:hypothetical protein CC86DRAFT_368857 [Ophiobolus disseminans]